VALFDGRAGRLTKTAVSGPGSEKVCRYPVEELHSRALNAEPEISSLMAWLMNKHGQSGLCEPREQRNALRAQLSILRQLVDTFIQEIEEQAGLKPPEEQVPTRSPDGGNGARGGDKLRRDRTRSRRSSELKMMREDSTEQSGLQVKVKMKNTEPDSPLDAKPVAFVKQAYGGSKSTSFRLTASTDAEIENQLPDEPTMRDKLRLLELDFPPLKYHVVVNNDLLYSNVVNGFLRDIAQDTDYDIYAVNNWWDDLEKFGAINARFLAVRHGIRFEVTLGLSHIAALYDHVSTLYQNH
jgi:hypothetical protein